MAENLDLMDSVKVSHSNCSEICGTGSGTRGKSIVDHRGCREKVPGDFTERIHFGFQSKFFQIFGADTVSHTDKHDL